MHLHCLTGDQKMATTINLELQALQDKSSRYELLDWLNNLLQTKFNKMEDICSGRCCVLL